MKKFLLLPFAILFAVEVFADKMPPLPEGAFTYVVIPDTQAYDGEGRSTKGGRAPGTGPVCNAQFVACIDWIVANREKENIRFVTHTGDITDMNNEAQWAFASETMAKLEGVVPYAICPGNHDMRYNGDTSLFQRYFPASRFAKNSWYAGTFEGFTDKAGIFTSGNNANSCCLFESGNEKFVVIHLECNAPDPVLKWAGEMLEKYSERHAIIATHQDLGAVEVKNARTIFNAMSSKETRKNYKPDTSILGRMKWFKCHGKDGNSGYDIWRKFSSRHKNVFLVVSGDQGMIKIVRVDDKGINGNRVTSLMQDTGGGFIRIFRFIPSEKRIACYTIDPRRDGELVRSYWCWRDEKWFNFELPYPGCEAAAEPASGRFALVSPAPGATVPIVPAPYKEFLSLGNAERRRLYADPKWRKDIAAKARNKPSGVTFAWAGVIGGKLTVRRKCDGAMFCEVMIPSNTYTLANFEVGREYDWSVTADDGRVLQGAFRTEDLAPRIIDWPGVPNVRDLGGRKGLSSRKVRQGLIYRSAGLNYNAVWKFLMPKDIEEARANGTLEMKLAATVDSNGRQTDVKKALKRIEKEIKKSGKLSFDWCDRRYLIPGSAKAGDSRMSEAAREWACSWLGIKTDLDLRTYREVYGMKGSPLGPGVRFVNYSSAEYDAMDTEWGRKAFVNDFRVFLERENYPVVVHCIAGADRTGALACILNGLLGVAEDDLYRDWEITGLTHGKAGFVHERYFDRLIKKVFDKYEGRTLNDRIKAYVLSCGITEDEIDKFREIMLEPALENPVPSAADAVTVSFTDAEILVASNASKVVLYAAREMQESFKRMSGVDVPLVTKPTKGRYAFCLGTNIWSVKAGLHPEKLKRDSYCVRIGRKAACIAGCDAPGEDPAAGEGGRWGYWERATLFGVYGFLERHAGVRFYFPGELGTAVPTADKLTLAIGTYNVTPRFPERDCYINGAGPYLRGWSKEKSRLPKWRYKLMLRESTARISCCHGQNKFKIAERFSESNPEYFQLRKNGTRCTGTVFKANWMGRHLCHTSPVWDIFRIETLERIRKGAKCVDIMPQDALQACWCAECQRVYNTTNFALASGFASELIWAKTAEVANAITAAGLDGCVSQMAYGPCRNIPSCEIPKNVKVVLAVGGPWALSRPQILDKQIEFLRAWSEKLGARASWVWTYPMKNYGRLQAVDVPQVAPRAFAHFFERAAPYVDGSFVESNEGETLVQNYLNFYVFSKFAWDGKIDVEAVLSEHHRLMFGKGAREMAEFFDTLEHIWITKMALPSLIPETEIGPYLYGPKKEKIWTEIYTPAVVAGLRANLEAAAAAVEPESIEARRIAWIRNELFDDFEKQSQKFNR